MKELSIIAVWIIMALSLWGLIDLLNRFVGWVRQVYWLITDEDDMCQYPEISDVA